MTCNVYNLVFSHALDRAGDNFASSEIMHRKTTSSKKLISRFNIIFFMGLNIILCSSEFYVKAVEAESPLMQQSP